jgi:Asp-tRNA(Asn)/Glu-tRNA(Gln) amidotransferase A subunit family amidase
MKPAGAEDLACLSASDLAPRLRERTLRVVDVAEACLARIAARDEEVRAWSYLRPEQVRAEARRLDAAAIRGRLHGIPVGIKDVILTKDMPTQYNSPFYDNFAPAIDAACVATLRAAGALIFGKCDTVEFAAMGRRARTRNPHDLARTPGGSSSGSAAAVADLQVPLALGTQTGGSAIRPASFCGVYAMKPTWNAVSREGLKMYSASLDTLAWYGRCVGDLALVADVFALEDAEARAVPPLQQLRIGLCRTPAWPQADAATVDAMASASAALTGFGVTLEEIVLPPLFDDILAVHDTIMIGEGVGAFLSEFRLFGEAIAPEFRRRLHDDNRYSRADLVRAYDIAAQCRVLFEQIAAPFDAILTPSSAGEATLGLASTGSANFNRMWTLLHAPCINIPVARPAGALPLGLTLAGPRYADRHLLAVAERLAPVIGADRSIAFPEARPADRRQDERQTG